jgi:hypothetical protein
LTATRGMSVVMHSTIVDAVTTRLGSQQAPLDKQEQFGCAHPAQKLVAKQGCVYRHNTFQVDFSTPWMELVAKCIRQERTVKLWMQLRAARAARDAREPYRAARAGSRSGSRPRGTIERSETSTQVHLVQRIFCSRSGLLAAFERLCHTGHCLCPSPRATRVPRMGVECHPR